MARAKTQRNTTNGNTKTTPTNIQLAPAVEAMDSRKKLIPINLEEEIRRRAYELSEKRGFKPGHENDDWFNAEREVLSRYGNQHQSV